MKNNIFKIVKKITLLFLLLFLINSNNAQTKSSIVELNKDEYLRKNGNGYEHGGQSIWAWLENNDTTKAQKIHDIIQFWGTVGEPGEPYLWRWRTNWDLTCVLLYRVLYQYGNIISKSDSIFLENKFLNFIRKSVFNKYNFNNKMYDYTLRYLYSQHHKNISVYYPSSSDLPQFSYNNRTYTPGNYYNSYEISRDWLFWRFNFLVNKGNYELDGYYTMAIIVSLYTIYDFSINKEIKKRAKMLLDLLLLDSTMDFSAKLHGGWIGRNYPYSVMAGQPNIYQWIYWRKGSYPNGSVLGSLYDAYVSDYRPPGLIEDIGIFDDEPNNYWHLNIESNGAGGLNNDRSKWTYVTKFYNMGGSEYVLNRGWQLNIASNDEEINYPNILFPTAGIKIWINDTESLPEYGDTKTSLALGKEGYQYKNYLLAKVNNPYLHFGGLGNVFDIDETISDWRFLKEEKVAVAIKMLTDASAIEVCTIGIDYNSYDEFKNAILNNAQLIPSYNTQFINSHGDTLMNVGDKTQFNGKKIIYSPKRIYTETNIGEQIISWDNKIMTVQRHGRKSVYNFNNWTYEKIGSLKLLPPTPISITKINNCFEMAFTPVEGASFYNIYRDSIPEFIPDTTNGTNRVGSGIMCNDFSSNTINFIDTLNNIPSTSIFYKITSASGTESEPSTILGKYKYSLYTTSTTNFNSIATPFKTEDISNASDLCNIIPYCNSVATWDAVNQTYIQYVKNLNINNFDVNMGYPYHVNVTNHTEFSLVGIPAEPTFDLITTSGTCFNEIMLPLNKYNIKKASSLLSDIPACNSVAYWDTKKQYYKQYIKELPFSDFDVRAGYSYLVNVTADVVWPGGGNPKNLKKISNHEILFKRKKIPHLVWGKIDSDLSDINNKNKITQFDAYISSNPLEIINQNSPNCTIQNSFWIAQVGNFQSGWKMEDTLCVDFKNNAGKLLQSIKIELTSKPSDKTDIIITTNKNNIPQYFDIKQNYPNPFNQETLIQYEIPKSSKVRIIIYNLKGQKIHELFNRKVKAGYHSIRWDGKNDTNNQLSSGIYFINMTTRKFSKTIKVLLVR